VLLTVVGTPVESLLTSSTSLDNVTGRVADHLSLVASLHRSVLLDLVLVVTLLTREPSTTVVTEHPLLSLTGSHLETTLTPAI
jgi:hypothetical protein